MWLLGFFLLVSAGNALECYSCTGSMNGCGEGKCTGNYCIDMSATSDSGTTIGRGCYSLLAGAKAEPVLEPQTCVSQTINGSAAFSVCACNSGDYCAKGAITVDSRQGSLPCLCQKDSSSAAGICNGDNCITEGESKGMINYDPSKKFDFHMSGFPKQGQTACEKDTNVKFPYGERCSCTDAHCNANPETGNYDPARNTVKCFTDAGGYCMGSACTLRQHYIAGVTHKAWFSQGCQYVSEQNPFDTYCSSFEIGNRTEMECVCTTDLCNEQIEVAIASINGVTTPPTPTTTTPTPTPPGCPEDSGSYESCQSLLRQGYCDIVPEVKQKLCPRTCSMCGSPPTGPNKKESSTTTTSIPTTRDPNCNRAQCERSPGRYNRLNCPNECPLVDCTKDGSTMKYGQCAQLAAMNWCELYDLGVYCPFVCNVKC